MTRTLNQQMGDIHEADIPEWIGGQPQKASGSQWHAQGDAKNGEHLTPFPVTADGKSTLGKSIAVSRDMWRKIVEQTFNQDPALFLRFYKDESLRQVDIDLAVIAVRFFRELLEAARKWSVIEQEILWPGVLTAEDVLELLEAAKQRKLDQLPLLSSLDEVRGMSESARHGCDCCR
jgi:hypothetical protein